MDFVLILHNVTRWVVLVLAVYALVRMYTGLFRSSEFSESDRKSLSWFAISLDIQLLLGLVLYFGNGWASTLGNMGSTMSQSAVRFFAVEHITLMVVALILAHLAVVFVRRVPDPARKFRRGAIFITLAAVAIFFAIPWPWSGEIGRPFIRLAEAFMLWLV